MNDIDEKKVDDLIVEVLKLTEAKGLTLSESISFRSKIEREMKAAASRYCNEMPFRYFPAKESTADSEKEPAVEK